MTTQNSSKLLAIAVALFVNMAIFGGAAYLFDGRAHPALEGEAVALAAAHTAHFA